MYERDADARLYHTLRSVGVDRFLSQLLPGTLLHLTPACSQCSQKFSMLSVLFMHPY